MSQSPPFAVLPPPLPRSVLVTVLAWFVIGLSGLGIPISVISGLMFVAGSYGTANAEPLGALLVLAGPPVTFVAGIGLLLRWRWAWFYVLVASAALLVVNGRAVIKGPTPSFDYVSASGVKTTVLSSDVTYSRPLIVISLLPFVILLSRRVRSEFGLSHRNG